jgi:hypothetical protein
MRHLHRAQVALLIGLLVLPLPWAADAEWWALRPTDMVPADPSLTLARLSATRPALAVRSRTPGDLKWLVVPLPVTAEDTVTAVELCYRAARTGAHIRRLRLVEALDAERGLVVHDDPAPAASPSGECYRSTVLRYTPAAPVSLWMRLEFANTAEVLIIESVSVQVP